jgi:hypothetical protein
MGYWIELCCDLRLPGSAANKLDHGCLSNAAMCPGVLALTRTAALRALSILVRDGTKHGWRKTAKGLACPHCAKLHKKGETHGIQPKSSLCV